MRRFRRAGVVRGVVSGAQREMSPAEGMAVAQRVAVLARAARAWEAALADGVAADGPEFEPIAGVALQQFAAVSRSIAAFGHDQYKLAHVTATAGIPAPRWEIASRGWLDRIQGSHVVARRFNEFYREAWA